MNTMRDIRFRVKDLDDHWKFGIIGSEISIPGQLLRETFGQSTDLHDRHGWEVFEGDILRYKPVYRSDTRDDWEVGEVVFKDFAWHVVGDADELLSNIAAKGDFTIIGNIHDNPDFLSR